jgi:radical SAM protein (TIGR04043 family)
MKLTVLPREPAARVSDRSTADVGIADTPAQFLITELQSLGLRLVDPSAGAASRKGGAGPSDHKAVTVGGTTVMVPVHTGHSARSPYLANAPGPDGHSTLERDGIPVGRITFPRQPRFYGLQTFDGVPYWKVAVLHGADVLATTVLQTCIRYQNRETTCQFCAIGQSLKAGRTVARKTPEQLAEVARAAVLLDGVKHMVMTTGTPNVTDRGARVLCESAFAVKGAVDLPIQGQCEPPDDFDWFRRMRDAGVDTLGMHLEAVEPAVRERIMPGKASVPVEYYYEAFGRAVSTFGRGQVSTYILAGLGDSADAILRCCERLIGMGVYPFVVPFVPISGTPLAEHPAPDAAFMRSLLRTLGGMLADANLLSADSKAGCGKCGACSSLSVYERREAGAGGSGDAVSSRKSGCHAGV